METIVFLDRGTLTVELPPLSIPHRWVNHASTSPDHVGDRLKGATVAVTNKVRLRAPDLATLSSLKLIAVTATGYDCVDADACRQRGIRVANVPGYAQDSVAEHVFMLILALRRQLPALMNDIQRGAWAKAPHFAILDHPLHDLAGSILGLLGYGAIAKRVETIAKAFGMNVIIADRKGASPRPGRMAFEEVLRQADVISLHAPKTPDTVGLLGARELALMKPTALLVNTARGGLVDEGALAQALRTKKIGGAGVDVLTDEPPRNGNPLLDASLPNLIVTPHVAWASRQAQERLVKEVIENIESFFKGKTRNIVV